MNSVGNITMNNDSTINNNEEDGEEYGSSLDSSAASINTAAVTVSAVQMNENSDENIGSTPSNARLTPKTFISDNDIERKPINSFAQNIREGQRVKFEDMFNNHQRILGRNLNGTIAMTTQPSNDSELQLYRVLQRANLLAYFDTFICQGGDDVQQLYEAGEEEFLEIMALVGMAAKPLHVRRLQKALNEWATNPDFLALFPSPIMPPFSTNIVPQICQPDSNGQPLNNNTGVAPNASTTPTSSRTLNQPSQQQSSPSPQQTNSPGLLYQPGPITAAGNQSNTSSPSQFPNTSMSDHYSQPCSPSSMTPILVESQIIRLAEAAETLVKSLPSDILDLEPPLSNNNNGSKKRIVKEIENVMNMAIDDPRRMDEIRKYAAIYGRFDCKRKPEKPLTLHEVSVNEAAAQICSKVPRFLNRRSELFPLARQVVRDSGYQYSKGHSRSQSCRIIIDQNLDNNKRMRLDLSSSAQESAKTVGHEEDRKRRHDRLEGIVDQLKSLGSKQEEIKSQIKEANVRKNFQELTELQNELDMINNHHKQLINEKSQLEKQQQQNSQQETNTNSTSMEKKSIGRNNSKLESDKIETEDTNSQFSINDSNDSMPSLWQESHNSPSVNDINTSNANSSSLSANDNFANVKSKKKSISNVNTSSNGLTTVMSNSNDSIEYGKQINEAMDESLCLMNHVIEENIDVRLFNKYAEVLRSNVPNSLQSDSSNSNVNHSSSRVKLDSNGQPIHRQRGRPPKNVIAPTASEIRPHEMPNNLYEQLLSQQMQMYQTQLQQSLYAQAMFNELTVGGNNGGGCKIENNNENYICNDNILTSEINSKDQITTTVSNKNALDNKNQIENNIKQDEIMQSLNALINMSKKVTNETNIKSEINSSIEFKIT